MSSSLDPPQTGNRIRFVRACVLACEAACARETMLFPRLGCTAEIILRGRRVVASSRALCLSVGQLIS